MEDSRNALFTSSKKRVFFSDFSAFGPLFFDYFFVGKTPCKIVIFGPFLPLFLWENTV